MLLNLSLSVKLENQIIPFVRCDLVRTRISYRFAAGAASLIDRVSFKDAKADFTEK